jgi:hypothetical protein
VAGFGRTGKRCSGMEVVVPFLVRKRGVWESADRRVPTTHRIYLI